MAQYALDADPMVDSLLPWVAARVASASTGSEVQQALAVAPPSVSVRTLPLEVFAVPGNVGEERKLGEMVMLRPGMAEKEGLLPGQLAQVSFGPGEATTTLIPTCTPHVSLPPLFLVADGQPHPPDDDVRTSPRPRWPSAMLDYAGDMKLSRHCDGEELCWFQTADLAAAVPSGRLLLHHAVRRPRSP